MIAFKDAGRAEKFGPLFDEAPERIAGMLIQ
jgi:hypothetical protein